MTETAGQEWRAYIDRHFEPEADNAGRTVGDRFPTTHELRVAKEAVLEDIPLNLRVLVEGDDDTGSVPILTVGDAFRSKRAKIHEFNYRKMGQPIPSTRDSFFKKQRTIIEGNNRDTLSQGSVASGSSVVSGASGPLKRKRAPSGSPSIDRVSIASQRSNSIAPLGPGTGPNVAYRSAESHCSDILEKTDDLIGKIESRDFEKTKHYAAKIVNHLVAKRIVDSKFTASKYCFDSVRHTFDETAQRKNVLSALHRCKEALRKRVPRGVSMATVRPIILVPSAIQSVINLYNAKALLSEGLWVDPIQAEKRSQVSAGNDVMFVNRAKCPFREFLIRDSAEKMYVLFYHCLKDKELLFVERFQN